MMKFLRSQSQTVLIVILGVIGLGFLFYGNSGNFLSTGANTPTDFGRIDGEDLSVADLYNAVRNTRNLMTLSGREQEFSQAQIAEQAWSQLLLLHEATKLHIDVSDEELVTFIQSRPEFQKNGIYSPDLYQTEMSNLQSHHISADTYAAIVHDFLRIEAVKRALFSSIRAPASDVAAQYEKYFGPAQISYVTFDPKAYVAATKISPDEIAAAYKADTANPAYRTEEKRKVDYVLFPLTPEQMKLPEKDKQAAIQALGEKALDFALAFQPDPSATANTTPPAMDFQAEARKRALTPISTDFFSVSMPPPGFPPSPAFNNAAFVLTKEEPISKVVELDNGVAVLHLDEIQASELKPLAEVTPAIQKDLQQKQAAQDAQAAAIAAAEILRAAVEKGTDFKTAAAAQHLTVQTLSSFVPLKTPQNDQRLQTLAYATLGMGVGELSKPVPIEIDNTVLILHLDSRAKADAAGFTAFEQRYDQIEDSQVRDQTLADWTAWQSKQPGTHPPPNLIEYGAVE